MRLISEGLLRDKEVLLGEGMRRDNRLNRSAVKILRAFSHGAKSITPFWLTFHLKVLQYPRFNLQGLLRLRNNNFSDISVLGNLTNPIELILRDNNISAILALASLSKLNLDFVQYVNAKRGGVSHDGTTLGKKGA